MMSTMNSSVYRQHIDETTHEHRVRPVVVGAPYVLCGFAVGVILLAVGTFVTSHAYDTEDQNPVLLGVGPGLLGLGGLLLLSSVLICVIACFRNRKLRDALSDDFFTIGASTFYGSRQFIPLDDENRLSDDAPPRRPSRRRNPAVDSVEQEHNEAVMILANTVEQERQRQKKSSRKFPRTRSYERQQEAAGVQACYMGPQELFIGNYSREDLEHLGLERIHRTEPLHRLAQEFDLGESDDSMYYRPRDRAYSMKVPRSGPNLAPVEQRLRRNLTYTQASRARQQQQQQLQRQQYLQSWDAQQQSPQRKRSSRRRRKQDAIAEASETVTVHKLPQYNPDLLHALGITSDRPQLQRGISDTGRVASNGVTEQPGTWWEDPNVIHGSLRHPRRRPSVVMGVKSIRSKQSGSGYVNPSSVCASDADLLRTEPSDVSQVGHEPRMTPSPSASNQYISLAESTLANPSLGSSPVLQRPSSYEDFPSQLDKGRENSPAPKSSTASLSQGRRPLSNISSESESCCSTCCKDGHDGVEEGLCHRQDRPDCNHEDAVQDSDQKTYIKKK